MYNNNVFIRHFYYDKLTHQTRIHAKKRRGAAWRPGSRQIEAITEYTVVSTERQFAIDTLGHYAADAAGANGDQPALLPHVSLAGSSYYFTNMSTHEKSNLRRPQRSKP